MNFLHSILHPLDFYFYNYSVNFALTGKFLPIFVIEIYNIYIIYTISRVIILI